MLLVHQRRYSVKITIVHALNLNSMSSLTTKLSGITTLQTIPMDTLPDEVGEIIISMVVFSSQFSWPDHRCHVYNQFRKLNTRFHMLTERLRSTLPRVHISSDGEPGTVSVCKLMKTFGPGSGIVLELKRIISHPKWENASLTLVSMGLVGLLGPCRALCDHPPGFQSKLRQGGLGKDQRNLSSCPMKRNRNLAWVCYEQPGLS